MRRSLEPSERRGAAGRRPMRRSAPVAVSEPAPLAGGASRALWSFDAELPGGEEAELVLLVTKGTAEREWEALRAAHARGIAVAEPLWRTADGEGIVLRRLAGEAIPSRIFRDERFAAARGRLLGQIGRGGRRDPRDPARRGAGGRRRGATGAAAPSSTRSRPSSTATATRTRRSSWACAGCAGDCRTARRRFSSTATSGWATCSSTGRAAGGARLGAGPRAATRPRTSAGSARGPGASAATICRRRASARARQLLDAYARGRRRRDRPRGAALLGGAGNLRWGVLTLRQLHDARLRRATVAGAGGDRPAHLRGRVGPAGDGRLMQDRPDAHELLEALERYLRDELLDAVPPEHRFRRAGRGQRLRDPRPRDGGRWRRTAPSSRALAAAIRAGEWDERLPELAAALRPELAAKLGRSSHRPAGPTSAAQRRRARRRRSGRRAPRGRGRRRGGTTCRSSWRRRGRC